jgi:hypothetical protein
LLLLLLLHRLQVSDALAAAELYREQLQRRGVFVVPLPVYGDDTGECPLRSAVCISTQQSCCCSMLHL